MGQNLSVAGKEVTKLKENTVMWKMMTKNDARLANDKNTDSVEEKVQYLY